MPKKSFLAMYGLLKICFGSPCIWICEWLLISNFIYRHYPKDDILMWEKLFKIRHPEVGFQLGERDLPWYNMAKWDKLGKFHWHPEFRPLDYYIPAYNPRKNRPEGKEKGHGFGRVKKLFPPIPDEDVK